MGFSDAFEGVKRTPASLPPEPAEPPEIVDLSPRTGDPRLGVELDQYLAQLRRMAGGQLRALRPRLQGRRVTVLGTEECMLPGLLFGEALEREGVAREVRFHATTRSPIGLCGAEGYPIRSGCRLHSFYDAARTTFLYDLSPCDAAVVYTDSPDADAVRLAAADLAGALAEQGCRDIILLREARHVQHL